MFRTRKLTWSLTWSRYIPLKTVTCRKFSVIHVSKREKAKRTRMTRTGRKRGKTPSFEVKTGSPGGDRTRDHLLRRQVLYPTELPDHGGKVL